jgi:hypothetical protein
VPPQCFLTKGCYSQQIRRFAVFLALPSATIRGMVAKQLKVRGGSGGGGEQVWQRLQGQRRWCAWPEWLHTQRAACLLLRWVAAAHAGGR